MDTIGAVGTGGVEFLACTNWQRVDKASCLLVNHQESEPNSSIHERIGRWHALRLAALFDRAQTAVDAVTGGGKRTDREWLAPLDRPSPVTICEPSRLLPDPWVVSGTVIGYTESAYEHGPEGLLLRVVADAVIDRIFQSSTAGLSRPSRH